MTVPQPEDIRRLMEDPVFIAALAATEESYKSQMAQSVSDAELHLAHRKLRVLYDVVNTIAVQYETAMTAGDPRLG